MNWAAHAINEVLKTYGDKVDLHSKGKSLNKFGRTANADSAVKTTLMTLPGAAVNETFVTTNAVDEIVSDSASDTGVVTVEGHYYDASNDLIFVVQDATLTGLTPVTLSTALSRCNRVFAKAGTFAAPASDLVGNVYVYDSSSTTVVSGVPQTASAVKCMVVAGLNQTEKAATSISSTDYWFITAVRIGISRSGGATVNADADIEWRQQGGVWRPLGLELQLRTASAPYETLELRPFRIIPPNSDVRLVVTSDAADTEAAGSIDGVLAKVVG